MSIFLLVSQLLLIILIVKLVVDLKKGRREAWSLPLLKGISIKLQYAILILIAVPIALVSSFSYEPDLSSKEKRIDHYEVYSEHLSLYDMYNADWSDSNENPHLDFKRVRELSEHIKSLKSHHNFDLVEFRESPRSLALLRSYVVDPNSATQREIDRSCIFQSLHYIDREELRLAREKIDEIEESDHPYYSFVRGVNLIEGSTLEEFEEGVELLEKSILDSMAIADSYYNLGIAYYRSGFEEELDSLVRQEEAFVHINNQIKRIACMRSGRFTAYWKVVFGRKIGHVDFIGAGSAALILLFWLFFLRRLDVFERERWKHLLLTLFMCTSTIFLVYPISDFLWDVLNYYPRHDSFESFIYMTVSIGMVEELVKIIPVLLVLRFTKAINEPIDYIIYCSVAALGFAFIENISYLQHDSLYNVNARAFMSTVAHMVFSSTIGYGLMLVKHRDFGNKNVVLLTFFVMAAAMHGFYDFWLLNESVREYQWITHLFLIVVIHFWFLYLNNAYNISNFYREKIEIRNDQLFTYLLLGAVLILMASYVINSLTRGSSFGAEHLFSSVVFYGFVILYLSLALSRFVIVRGYIAPMDLSFDFLFPRPKRHTHNEGQEITILATKRIRFIPEFEKVEYSLPNTGTLKRRLAVDNNLESYLIGLDKPISFEGHRTSEIVILPKSDTSKLITEGSTLIYFLLIPDELSLDKPSLLISDFSHAGWAVVSKKEEGSLDVNTRRQPSIQALSS